MTDIHIRAEMLAGRVTLQRPHALNAMTYPMCLAIKAALREWHDDPKIKLIVIDAEGERAFCAGGDVADMYHCEATKRAAFGQKFWRDEYRMNAEISDYPKPIVSFLQGFVMGGGVGVGCHGSHRIVGESSQVAMPECAIGLIPDVGGSYLLAKGIGRAGEYLGMTGQRMNAADAILMDFADFFVAEASWKAIKRDLCQTGDLTAITMAACAPSSPNNLSRLQNAIDRHFGAATLADVVDSLENDNSKFATGCLKNMQRNSPLSMACTKALIGMQRHSKNLCEALTLEYRFVSRSLELADFLEGIRARIIDKDNQPKWQHSSLRDVRDEDIETLLAPLENGELTWQEAD